MSLITTNRTQTFDIGDRPTLVATFRRPDGVLSNPGAITFRLMAPDGTIVTETDASAINPSVGVWEWQIPDPFDAPGTWKMHALATAGIQVAEEVSVTVRKTSFPYPPGP